MIIKKIRIDALKWAILSFLALRIFSVLVIEVLSNFPIQVKPTFSDLVTGYYEILNLNDFSEEFLAPWFRWDTVHYLRIAREGYGEDPGKIAWPPLYPFLIKILSYVIKPPIFSAIILSNLFSILSFYQLFIFTMELIDEMHAKKTLLFTIFFPSAFFLIAGYSESLFLFLSIICFRNIKRENWLWAGIFSGLATLCRVQGLLLLIPIVIKAFERKQKNGIAPVHLMSILIAPIVYGLFSIYTRFGLRQAWPWKSLLTIGTCTSAGPGKELSEMLRLYSEEI